MQSFKQVTYISKKPALLEANTKEILTKDYRAPQDAELKLYLLLEREIRMGAISASGCFVSH